MLQRKLIRGSVFFGSPCILFNWFDVADKLKAAGHWIKVADITLNRGLVDQS